MDPVFTYPDFTIFSFINDANETRYQAYGETWACEMNPETGEITYADFPIEGSEAIYAVEFEVYKSETVETTYDATLVMIDQSPVDDANESYAADEDTAEADQKVTADATASAATGTATASGTTGAETAGSGAAASAAPAPVSGGAPDPAPADPNAGKTWYEEQGHWETVTL